MTTSQICCLISAIMTYYGSKKKVAFSLAVSALRLRDKNKYVALLVYNRNVTHSGIPFGIGHGCNINMIHVY